MSNPTQVPRLAAVMKAMDRIGSIAQIALGGIQTNLRGLKQTAQTIASASGAQAEPTDLADPLIRALEQQRALEASAKVLRHADEMLGALLAALA